MSAAKKRSVSSLDAAGPSDDAEEFLIDVGNPKLRCIKLMRARGRNDSGWVLIRERAYHSIVLGHH